uniref:Si:ch211-191d15.2 n=1 Tax=Oryzias latipes TaxID=8090 RepID=A0A3P9L107_ORYLA
VNHDLLSVSCCICDALLVLCICPLACLAMSDCPPGCCCPHSGFLVLCESLGLRSLPRSVPLSTAVLSVAKNQLCDVDNVLWPLRGLQELSLSQNLLARFPRGLPPSLESLLLQENRITYITSGALRQLRNLTRLDLEDNRISAIQSGALLGLKRLQVLTLKGNKLRSLPLNLPSSLMHLDVSENCISSLHLPSLAALVNLQVLKINSNCLRSVPENTFDSMPRLRSVDLNNNLWVCECNILYLYRWLLSGRLKMTTDLVCKEPVHLAHRLLLNLSVMSICPCVLQPNRKHQLDSNSSRTIKPTNYSFCNNKDHFGKKWWKISKDTTVSEARNIQDLPKIHVLPYYLETLTYEECLSLNKTHTDGLSHLKTTASSPEEEETCNTTTPYPQSNTSADRTQPWPSSNREEFFLTLNPIALTQQDSGVIVSLLALMFVLLTLIMLTVLIVLKKLLVRQQRVAPADVGSGG